MPHVLVVHPPMTIARDWIDYPYFTNLGAVQLAACLRRRFGTVTLVDSFALSSSTLHWRRDGRAHLGASLDEVLGAIERAEAIDHVVVTVTPFHRPPHRDDVLASVLRGIRMIHPNVRVILADAYQSGQHYVEVGDALLASYPEASAWLKYEAEASIFDALDKTGVLHGAPPDLDALPAPAWDLVDLEALDRFRARVIARSGRRSWHFPIDGRTLPMVTSRGCPFRCAHCSSNPGRAEGEPKLQRRLSQSSLRDHMAALVERGVTRVTFLDELINVHQGHLDAVLELLETHDLSFEVPNGFRADYLSRPHLTRMADRVTTISVSAESGSQRVLDEVVGKALDLDDIERVAEEAHQVGVPLLVHFMIGLPHETAIEINETLTRALDLFDRFGAEPAVQYATPLPGTRLAEGRTLPMVDDWGPHFQRVPSHDGSLGASLERFRQTFDARLAASRGPEKLIMNVTYACNNHCTFCAVGTRTQIDGHPPRQREYLDLYRARGVTMVDFDGGEPTLNPELIGLVRHASSIGYERINVTTNGRRLAYDDYARALVTSGLSTLLFSVHGPDARTHAQQVGVMEAFEQTVEGIRRANAHRPAGVELGMNVTVTKGNHDKIDAIAQLAWDLELPWLNIQFLTPFGRATKWVAPDTQLAADHVMRVIDTWRERMKIQIVNLPFCFMPGYEKHLSGDLAKLSRHMVFVNNETVNLSEYLAERRVKKPVCAPCPHACFCGGFYELDDVPEPPWLVAAEDLLRPTTPLIVPRQ